MDLANSRRSRRNFRKALAALKLLADTKACLDDNLGLDPNHLSIAIKLHLVVNVNRRSIDSIDELPLHVLLAAVPVIEESPVPARVDRLWQCVERRCLRSACTPSEVRTADCYGRTCLHAACEKNAPTFVIREILSACANEGAAFEEDGNGPDLRLTRMQDNRGLTPLFLTLYNEPVQLIHLLLHADPTAASIPNADGRLPLDIAITNDLCFGLIRKLIDVYPEGAMHEDKDGMTPLHTAIQYDASEQMVKALLDGCPSSASLNRCGFTPLFNAIANDTTPASVIQALVDADPSAAERAVARTDDSNPFSTFAGWLPIHFALYFRLSVEIVTILANASPKTLVRPCNEGWTALHFALMQLHGHSIASEEVIRVLLHYAPDACNCRDVEGLTPLDYIIFFANDKIREKCEIQQAWDILCLVLRAATNKTIEASASGKKRFLMLHSVASIDGMYWVVKEAISRNREQIMAVDENGRIPLMCALLPSPLRRYPADPVVDALLKMGPDAAKVTDSDGRSVLALAAEYGAVTEGVLERLITAFPGALYKSDPKYGGGMYPFMVAALPKQRKSKRSKKMQLGAVFTLLRAAPDLLLPHCCVK